MKKKLNPFLPFFLLALSGSVNAQNNCSIPAFTAYAVPAEMNNTEDESNLIDQQNGLLHWTDRRQQIQFYFRVRNPGKLGIAIRFSNKVTGNKISISISGKNFILAVPGSAQLKLTRAGTVILPDTGYYRLTINCIKQVGETIADIKSLELSGKAAEQIHFNPEPRRNAASVHLFYPLDDSMKVVSFYNEITIPKDADLLHSYYMACGFTRGYFGIQVNSPSERRVIFSVWDAGTEARDRNKVEGENKVKLIARGENVFADGFGNEGTGGHSHWIYNWKAGETYRFLVTAAMDSASNSTSYAGYFFIPESQKWKLIACFKAPKDGKPLRRLYSFVENFDGSNGQLYRKAVFSNQWVRRENGDWKELTRSTFSYDATGKAGDRLDYGGGADSNKFYLWNGGFVQSQTKFGDIFLRTASNQKPGIDLYKNEDSTAQSNYEKAEILNAIYSGKFDTTGSLNGVYFKIIKEGNGAFVHLNDTLVVNYKGTLLSGELFDETNGKPATFPLKRLIKGWQTVLPFCRQGGKIKFIIPSALGYTIRNLGEIPPKSILVFEVEVLEIIKGNL